MRSSIILFFLFRCILHEPYTSHVVDGANARAVEEFVSDEEGEEEEGLWICMDCISDLCMLPRAEGR